LGRLRAALEEQGLWEQTWLLVTADHSWRESHRYDGRFDERIPWLLKAPGHTEASEFCQPFNTVATRHLLLAILRHEVSNLAQARDWLERHAPNLPPITDLSPNDH
jgi:arylsulfatase A-like enzyme